MLSTKSFWEKFYVETSGSEWYFQLDDISNFIDNSIILPFILHAGCGSCYVKDLFAMESICIEFDFASTAFQKERLENNSLYNLLIADALHMPYLNSYFDIIVEKGLFDSVTAGECNRLQNGKRLIAEYNRVLRKSGVVLIYSIFAPDSSDKDMLGLLSHTNFNVNCKSLYISPAEIPTQDFCFLYILTKVL
jgi:SAM-dependent methyltransferase